VVTLHSPKDRFYRPTAETIDFTYPKFFMQLTLLAVVDDTLYHAKSSF